MKIYIAASFPRKNEANELASRLGGQGHDVISQWHEQDSEYGGGELPARAERDLCDIADCDILVSLTGDDLSHGGRHGEVGAALAYGKEVCIVGPREMVFHHHETVQVFSNVDAFLGYVR